MGFSAQRHAAARTILRARATGNPDIIDDAEEGGGYWIGDPDDIEAYLEQEYPDGLPATPVPRLTVETVSDDKETYEALHCPVCGRPVEPDTLTVAIIHRAIDVENENTLEHGVALFGPADDTVTYRHDDHQVALPTGWRVRFV